LIFLLTQNSEDMKLAIKTFIIAIVAVAINTTAFAAKNTDKAIRQAREAVEAASPDDWHTYAEAAEICISKGANMKEAAMWIKQSIAVKETSYNLKVLGDYYVANRLPEKAVEAYGKSIRVGKLSDNSYRDKVTQDKIVALIKQLG
jgi:tetratricopeptide (TPR) repeat protein